MPFRERTVLVIATGLALAVIASTLAALLWHSQVGTGGWFAYAPDTSVTFADGGVSDATYWLIGGIWLLAIGLWASFALRIYRAPFDGTSRIGQQPS